MLKYSIMKYCKISVFTRLYISLSVFPNQFSRVQSDQMFFNRHWFLTHTKNAQKSLEVEPKFLLLVQYIIIIFTIN